MLVTGEAANAAANQCRTFCIEAACPVKTISKVSPTWAASMAVRPASPSFRRARARVSATATSWQSATPAKPIARRRRPNQNSASPAAEVGLAPGTAAPLCRWLGAAARDGNGGWLVFWICWNTAWSLIISGIMVATIVSHPDSEFIEVQAARRSM